MSNIDNLLYIPLAALFIEILFSMNNVRLTKLGKKLGFIYNVIPLLGFLVFNVSWWFCPSSYTAVGGLGYVFGFITSLAFLVGSSIVTTDFLVFEYDGIWFKQNHFLFKMMKTLEINPNGDSICGVSWTTSLKLILMPLFISAIYILLSLVGLIICIWTFQNPITYIREILEFGGWPRAEMRRNKYGIWISPTPYLLGIGTIGGLYYLFLTLSKDSANWMPFIIVFAAICVLILFHLFSNRLGNTLEKKYDKDFVFDKLGWQAQDTYITLSRSSDGVKRDFLAWRFFFSVLQHKICPRIRFRGEDSD